MSGYQRCEFFFPTQSSNELQKPRGYYRTLGSNSDGVQSFSLVESQSTDLLSSFSGHPLSKVYFIGFPGPLDLEFGLEAMAERKASICNRYGLEAVFPTLDPSSIPHVLRDRTHLILLKRSLADVESCAAACVDVTPRSKLEELQTSWYIGMFSGSSRPVVAFAEATSSLATGEGAELLQRSLLSCDISHPESPTAAAREEAYLQALEKAIASLRDELTQAS